MAMLAVVATAEAASYQQNTPTDELGLVDIVKVSDTRLCAAYGRKSGACRKLISGGLPCVWTADPSCDKGCHPKFGGCGTSRCEQGCNQREGCQWNGGVCRPTCIEVGDGQQHCQFEYEL